MGKLPFMGQSLGVAKDRRGSQRRGRPFSQGKRDQTSGAAALTSGTGNRGGPENHDVPVSAKGGTCKPPFAGQPLNQAAGKVVLPFDHARQINRCHLAALHHRSALDIKVPHAGWAAQDQAGHRIP